MAAHDLHHLILDLFDRLVVGEACDILAAQIRCQHDDRVGEIDRAALPIGQAAVVQHLEQDVEDVAMGFLDLIEQDDLIGTTAHGFGQDAAFLIAHIARRRADQPGDAMLLHELAHVDADHRIVVVE